MLKEMSTQETKSTHPIWEDNEEDRELWEGVWDDDYLDETTY